MHASIRTLLAEIIDYAGLFPPAELALVPAVRNYASYRASPEAWMLARFVCPTAQLEALRPIVAELFTPEAPLPLSVIPRAGQSRDELVANLKTGLTALQSFLDQTASRARVEAFELRLPDGDSSTSLIDAVAGAFDAAGFASVPAFVEPAVRESEASALRQFAAALAERGARDGRFGLKLRCGGTQPAAFPSSPLVASVLTICRDERVPLKFTAGLHHPLPRFDHAVRARMHGFLNVFVAGVLAHAVALDHHDVLAVLEEQDLRQFHFSGSFLGWHDFEASVAELRDIRRSRLISFGSCSFTEPRDDLRMLRLI